MRQIRGIFINSFISHLLFIQQFSKVPTVATKENTSEEEALRKKKMNGSISRADSQRDKKKRKIDCGIRQTKKKKKTTTWRKRKKSAEIVWLVTVIANFSNLCRHADTRKCITYLCITAAIASMISSEHKHLLISLCVLFVENIFIYEASMNGIYVPLWIAEHGGQLGFPLQHTLRCFVPMLTQTGYCTSDGGGVVGGERSAGDIRCIQQSNSRRLQQHQAASSIK